MMARLPWRWIVLVLLLANSAVFLLGRTAAPAPEPAARTTIERNPDLPVVELISSSTTEGRNAVRGGCYTIGPLPTLLAQQRAQDRLAPFVSAMQLRQTEADRDRGWWVYLPTPDRNAALALTRQLAEKGVEDYYVIAGGALENAVSVGLYENLDNARRRQHQIRLLGFSAQLDVRRETTPQFWVDYRVEADQEPPWQFILRASPGAQRVAMPCSEYRLPSTTDR